MAETGAKEIQILTGFSEDSNGYSSVSGPEWTTYTDALLVEMAEQLATTYGSLDSAQVLCRLVTAGQEHTYDLVAYDSYFLIDVSDLAEYQEEMDRAAALAEEIEAGAERLAYIQTAKDEYQNMWKYVLDKADEWNFNQLFKDTQAEVQDSVYTKVFSVSDCFMNLIHKALVSAGEISSSTDGSYKNATEYMRYNQQSPADDPEGCGAFWYTIDGKVVIFSKESKMEEREEAGMHALSTKTYDGVDDEEYTVTCVLGSLILEHFDRSGVRWNDYKEDGKDKIKNHFNICDL